MCNALRRGRAAVVLSISEPTDSGSPVQTGGVMRRNCGSAQLAAGVVWAASSQGTIWAAYRVPSAKQKKHQAQACASKIWHIESCMHYVQP